MIKSPLLIGSLLLLVQGCSSTLHTPNDSQLETNTDQQAQIDQTNSQTDSLLITQHKVNSPASFSDEKQAWLASEQWNYHGTGTVKNVGWNEQQQKGDLNYMATYSNNPTDCEGEVFITGPFYSNRISGIFNVNGQDVHFKYVSKVNRNTRTYRAKNPAGKAFLLNALSQQQPVVITSDMNITGTFPTKGFTQAKLAIDKECKIKLERDSNAL
ncbi:hypothetical protein A9264_08920 [Vibrio sp. UCD-FRSSP16_10]|uniref:hypothetical protein n=1 Tax=unclassified Vibrio TaxID=2614977 RepID=UPI00080119B0|nr:MULTISPECIES: hypothetical protein [unclassified Vibrio]OBT09382.1 hypothetical protein A9260_06020 [Vibrio sp. UCD-FRSSP16_30]OBT22061.1 hypothetical protein A9264_08920 [Vibrio sp. UCD-FRSSP16_10]